MIVISNGQVLGPFKSVETTPIGLTCDDVFLPFKVIGEYTISLDDSLAPKPVVSLPVPTSIPMLNARIILSRMGLLAAVNEYIASMQGQDGIDARIIWEFALTIRRDHPLVKMLATLLNKTEVEIDQLFIAANALEV